MDDSVGESNITLSKTEPTWVSTTLRLFPAPIFAVTTIIGCLIVAAIFLIQSFIHGDVIYWFIFGLFAFIPAVVAAASIARRDWPSRKQDKTSLNLGGGPIDNEPRHLLPWWAIALPTLTLAWAGSKISGEAFSIMGSGLISGAAVGFLIGVAIYLDDKLAQQRSRKISQDQDSEGAPRIPPPPDSRLLSDVPAVLMLIIPAVTALLIWQRQRLGLSQQASTSLSFLTVISTSALGYMDARQLRSRVSTSATGDSRTLQPGTMFAGMLAMWVLWFPAYFVARRRIVATNLIIPAVLATVLFIAPSLEAFFTEPELPAVDAPEVVSLVVNIFEKSPEVIARKNDIGRISIHDATEVSYNEKRKRRVARADLNSGMGTEVIFYSVEWDDISKGAFSVQIIDKP